MSILTLKLLRELWRSRWQYAAVGLMVILGTAFFGAAYMSYRNLDTSYHTSYDRLHFEHFGIALRGAPERVVNRLTRIPGVQAVEGRLVEDVAIELPGVTTRKLVGRLISVPANRPLKVNQLFIKHGRFLSRGTTREVLLESKFAEHHKLRAGDRIDALWLGERVRFRIAGIVQSPEYIYVVQSKQQILPMPDTFGVMFVSEEVLGSLVGKAGQVNEIKFRVQEGSDAVRAAREAKRILNPYGAEEPVQREDQPSHQLLEQDLQGFQSYAVLFPMLFLSTAGLTVYTLLMRMVHLQRTTVGLLRALGFSTGQVIRHYLGMAMLIGTLGSATGCWLGWLLSDWATRQYVTFLGIPYVIVKAYPDTLLAGFVIGLGVCLLAGIIPARAAARTGAAQALREAAPEAGRIFTLDKLIPFAGKMRLLWRIPLRNILRHPRRTISTIFGITAAIGLIVLAQGLLDSSEAAFDLMFREMVQDDIRVSFINYQTQGIANQVRNWRGVYWVEPVLELPVDFQKGNRTYSALMIGMREGNRLYRLKSEAGEPVYLSRHGMIFGQTLQMKLGVEMGDIVQVSIPRGQTKEESRVRTERVAGFLWEPTGTIAYLPIENMRRLFKDDLDLPPGAISSLWLKVDPRYTREVRERLLLLPDAASAQVNEELRKMFDELMNLSRRFVMVMLLFGASLAFCIVFNMVTINILERTNEVATLRTIGVGRSQIALMILLENLMNTLIGIAIGLPFGRMLAVGFITAAQTQEQMELFSFNVVISPRTYFLAALIILTTVVLSQIPALLHVNRLDLARAAKERAN